MVNFDTDNKLQKEGRFLRMRKALTAVTLMGLVAAFAVPAHATEVNVGGQIKTTITTDNQTDYNHSVEVKVQLDAKVNDNISAHVRFLADDDQMNFTIDEGYFQVNNLFNTPNLLAKVGYQDIVFGDSKIMDSTLDAVIAGYNTDYGLALAGTAEARGSAQTWGVGAFEGNLKALGVDGAYEVVDLYQDASDINLAYAKVTPAVATDFGKVGFRAEGAYLKTKGADNNGKFYGVGASLDAGMFGAKIGYDVYKDGFVTNYVIGTGFSDYDYAEVLDYDNGNFVNPKILTVEGSVKPMDKVTLSAAYVNFDGDNTGTYSSAHEVDLKAKYQYDKNLCIQAGLYLPSEKLDYQGELKLTLKF
ncbi:hypothetical protein [Desulfurobacterium sp. TC5-1]|uniref:hypothetical protein n=1 Tax=Desulfurobacterium sp. TC5-1 TaxID=1158318 RepID=UPI0003B604CE|nr:hypothetical protein [Desulfurobacterium sp. TC5-1]